MSEFTGLNLVVVDPFLDINIQAAVNKAKAAPGGAVWIPNSYTGTDAVPSSPGIPIFDMRNTGNVAAQQKIISAGSAQPVTATTGGTFVTSLNLPGSSAFEQVPFRVKAAGWVSFNGGTYTATVQPLVYASTGLGFTASAAAAILSATAANVTIAVAAAATLTYIPWEVELVLSGDTNSGILTGRVKGSLRTTTANTNSTTYPTTAANGSWDQIVNTPTGITFTGATAPIQFLCGVVVGGATVSAGIVNLGSFYITS